MTNLQAAVLGFSFGALPVHADIAYTPEDETQMIILPDLMRHNQSIYESAFIRFTERVEAWLRQWEKENAKPRRVLREDQRDQG